MYFNSRASQVDLNISNEKYLFVFQPDINRSLCIESTSDSSAIWSVYKPEYYDFYEYRLSSHDIFIEAIVLNRFSQDPLFYYMDDHREEYGFHYVSKLRNSLERDFKYEFSNFKNGVGARNCVLNKLNKLASDITGVKLVKTIIDKAVVGKTIYNPKGNDAHYIVKEYNIYY